MFVCLRQGEPWHVSNGVVGVWLVLLPSAFVWFAGAAVCSLRFVFWLGLVEDGLEKLFVAVLGGVGS